MVSTKRSASVSVIVPTRNSGTTVRRALESVVEQRQPVREIIVVDNASTDGSVERVREFSAQSPMPVRILTREGDRGVGASFNWGARLAESELVVLMHSDGVLPSPDELEKLVQPLDDDPSAVGTYPHVSLPLDVWAEFGFWQKCLFARAAGVSQPSHACKFDCVRRDVLLRIGGFDEARFSSTIGFGGEDGDFFARLRREGRVVPTDAVVIHLHSFDLNDSLRRFVATRKLLARTYGRLLRIHPREHTLRDFTLLVGRPIVAIVPFLPGLHMLGILLVLLYCIANSVSMYRDPRNYRDRRLLGLPLVDLFLLYYEAFWTGEGFFSKQVALRVKA